MKKERNLFLLFLTITVFYASAIFILSSLSKPPGAEEGKQAIPYFSTLVHITIYFGFAFFVFHVIEWYPGNFRYDQMLSTLLIVTLYGISDETHQIFVDGRFFSFWDIFFDSLGASLLLLLAAHWPYQKISLPFIRRKK
ncbi:MAG: VanZ family protein [Thermoplasmatota archaeon]